MRIPSHILGLATGVPAYVTDQSRMATFMANVLRATLPRKDLEPALERLASIYRNSRIERRHSVVADYVSSDPREFSFFPPNWRLSPHPSTADRMRMYETSSVDLAARVGRAALEKAGLGARSITHIVYCTCTGFFAPGPDIELMDRLGIASSTQRTSIGFMGCHAGINGLRTGEHIVRAEPGAMVLHVCLELCSLHLQRQNCFSAMLSGCLFGDGCSAVVYGPEGSSSSSSPRVRCLTTASYVTPNTSDQMSWRIGDFGFDMQLAVEIPRTLGTLAREFVAGLLDRADLRFEDVRHWGIHPGGPRILEGVRRALSLRRASLAPSYEVLRDYGNMSSPTIFFVLERILSSDPEPGPVVLLSFGPGLTMEGAVLMIDA